MVVEPRGVWRVQKRLRAWVGLLLVGLVAGCGNPAKPASRLAEAAGSPAEKKGAQAARSVGLRAVPGADAEESPEQRRVRREIQKICDGWTEGVARRDIRPMAAALAPDYRQTRADGAVVKLTEWKQRTANWVKQIGTLDEASWKVGAVVLEGEKARVQVRQSLDFMRSSPGQPAQRVNQVMALDTVWRKQGATWKMVSSISRPERPTTAPSAGGVGANAAATPAKPAAPAPPKEVSIQFRKRYDFE